jgi:hypothetical protein
MRNRLVIAGVLGTALYAVVLAAQAVQPRPGPGNGIVTVEGAVSIDNRPTVTALQEGEWKMTVANTPGVHVVSAAPIAIAPPDMVKAGVRYLITWSSGENETVTVLQPGPGSWARVDGSDRRNRWVNLGAARAIQEAP